MQRAVQQAVGTIGARSGVALRACHQTAKGQLLDEFLRHYRLHP